MIHLVRNPLHLVERHAVVPPVVQTGGSGGLVAGHLLRNFELAAVRKVGGDAGGPEAVATDLGLDAGGNRPALNHHVCIRLGERQPVGQFSVPHGREEGSGRVG